MSSRRFVCDFHPQFLHVHFQVDMGEAYYMDPEVRKQEIRKGQQGLYERYGHYSAVIPAPVEMPDVIAKIGFQPLDFLNAALCGKMEFRPDETVWTPEKPLQNVETMDDVLALPEIDWEQNTLYQNFLHQLEVQEVANPNARSMGMQCVTSLGNGNAKFVIHTPYTTAFRLMGERIFELMLLEEDVANALFDYLYRQYRNQAEHFCRRQQWKLTQIHWGDCAATMLSPDLFRQSNLAFATRIMEQEGFLGCTQHSCGPSTHLLEAFQEIPRLQELQLGFGTDLRKARELFPDTMILAYLHAAELLNGTPDGIRRQLEQMAENLQDNFCIMASAIDAKTPEANLQAFLEIAQAENAG